MSKTKLVISFDYEVRIVDFDSEKELSKQNVALILQDIYTNHKDKMMRQIWEESYTVKSVQKELKAFEVQDDDVIEKIIKGYNKPIRDIDSEYASEACDKMLLNILSQFALRSTVKPKNK